jgi:hypothetical protein
MYIKPSNPIMIPPTKTNLLTRELRMCHPQVSY